MTAPIEDALRKCVAAWAHSHQIDRLAAMAPAIKQARAVLAAQPAAEPLSEAQIEDCIDAANSKFNRRRQGPCGQQMTTYDDWKHWLAREIEAAARAQPAAEPVAWLVTVAKRPRFVRACWTEPPTQDQLDAAEYDDDIITPLYARKTTC